MNTIGSPSRWWAHAGVFRGGALFATGVNWLGWKMARPPRWDKIWWVPRVTSLAGNLAGYSLHPQSLDAGFASPGLSALARRRPQ